MATTATWWSELTKQASAAPHFFPSEAPRKGAFGSGCFHLTCRNADARWFNTDNCRYYCDSCARGINQTCAEQGRSAACNLRI